MSDAWTLNRWTVRRLRTLGLSERLSVSVLASSISICFKVRPDGSQDTRLKLNTTRRTLIAVTLDNYRLNGKTLRGFRTSERPLIALGGVPEKHFSLFGYELSEGVGRCLESCTISWKMQKRNQRFHLTRVNISIV